MNRSKSILLGATALVMFAAPQVASAQTMQGAAVVFLPVPATDTQPEECRDQNSRGSTRTYGISSDGTTVVGELIFNTCFVVWRNGVPEAQPGSQFGFGYGGSFSNDGRVIVGYSNETIGSVGRTRYWTASTKTMQAFPVVETLTAAQFNARFPAGFATRRGTGVAVGDAQRVPINEGFVNADGTVFALNTAYQFEDRLFGTTLTEDGRIVVWRPASGYLELPTFGANEPMTVAGIDGSGNRVVGIARTGSPTALFETETFAFLWDAANGLSRLPDLSASLSDPTRVKITQATGISRDGSTIIGFSRAADSLVHPVIWRGGVITDLGFLPGRTPTPDRELANRYIPLAASAGGVVIVGKVGDIDPGNGEPAINRAWRWSTATGMQDLQQVALSAGLNLNGFDLTEANGVSDDGQFISGNSYNAAQDQYLGFVLQLAQVTQSRLIVTIRLPGVTQTSVVNQTFNTQVDALLNGRSVFTRTVTDPINGAGGVAALADARSALQVGSGLRRVVIGTPTLLSNVTTVLGTTNTTVDVASGTSTTTATVNTFGPAVVATGDRGTCATPAANNTNPTGCSLPGTPVTVDTGILNSNVFTNTINSVTPTTTPTVNQLITARWQVAATAGNQFGTVHALGGVAAFDRGDRLIGQLLGQGTGGSAGAGPVARAKLPVGDAVGLSENGDSTLSMFGGYFNTSTRIDADAGVPVARTTGSAEGFVLGLEQQLGEDARIGVAVDHGTTSLNVRDPAFPETLRFKQTQIGLFGGGRSGRFAVDAAAAYGFGKADTVLVTPTAPATASRDIESWSLGAQASYAVPLGKTAGATLVTGVRHVSVNLADFAETGGPTPLLGHDDDVSRTRIYAGIEGEAKVDLGDITVTPRVHVRAARDGGDARGAADLVFVSAPTAAAMTAVGAPVGRTVAELGGSLEMDLSGRVTLWAGYDGQFRDGSRSHAARAGLTIRW